MAIFRYKNFNLPPFMTNIKNPKLKICRAGIDDLRGYAAFSGGKLSAGDDPKDRLGGSIAACVGQGVRLFRAHDVAETRQALAVFQAIGDD